VCTFLGAFGGASVGEGMVGFGRLGADSVSTFVSSVPIFFFALPFRLIAVL
jgi:hypothetical protein